MKKSIALIAAAGIAAAANAQYNVNLGNLNVNDAGISVDLMGAGIPAGNYTSFSVSADWVAGAGNPFSTEAIWAFTDAAFDPVNDDPNLFTFYADPGPSPDALGSGAPVTLTWNGFLSPNYQGGDSLWFNALQTFGGSDAVWGNVDITLGFDTVTAPASTPLGTNPDTMVNQPIAESEVQWFSFDVAGGAGALDWSISTAGSTNTGGTFGDDDTELGLYDAAGNLIATNDDEDFFADILTSRLDSDGLGALADGTYYIAVGNFNTTFGAAGFDVSSTSTAVGNTKLTVSFIPAPASLAMLGLGGLAAARRRR